LTKIEGALGLLSKGTKEWNVYLSALRDKEFNSNSEPEIIIENTTFKDLDIEGVKFSYVTFRHCVFNNCFFRRVNGKARNLSNVKWMSRYLLTALANI